MSAVSHIMTQLVDRFTNEQRKQLSQWVKAIENTAETKVQNLDTKQLKRQDPDVVAAAAVYDTFVEYESRTNVKVGLSLMQRALKRTMCSINNAWKKFFDNRVFLLCESLELGYIEGDATLSDAISKVIQALTRALDSPTKEAVKWIKEIETEALELATTLLPSSIERYDILLVANAMIYAAAKQHIGKMIVQLGQRELSLLASTSPAMISKCWLDLFPS